MSKKAVTKRIKVTKRGKMIRRPMGVNHFKSKKSGKQTREKRKTLSVHHSDLRMFKKYL